MASKIPRIGIGGPVGSGKTALIERMVPLMIDLGLRPLIITNDIFTREDADHARRALAGVLEEGRIRGVETGACPHTAVREDPTLNLMAVEELTVAFPDQLYVIDVAAGDKIPRKRGQGITQTDLLVINKTDLAPYVGADLGVMRRDAELVRGGKPFLFTNCRTGEGVDQVLKNVLEGAGVGAIHN